MPLIHIDILTPKQVRFFRRLIPLLEEKGHEVLVTARGYRETVELLELEKMQFVQTGRYGGSSLEGKLEASLRRGLRLAKLISDIHPDITVSHASPEAARVAFGLGIPHLCVNDSPHAEAVARLTVPLSIRLLTPKVIPKRDWAKYGIDWNAIIQYDAIDPAAWLRDLHPDKAVPGKLGLSGDKPIVVLRTEEAYASYLSDHRPRYGSVVVSVVRELFSLLGGRIEIVVLPRYASQVSKVKRSVPSEVKVAEHVIDTPSLLAASSVFIGGGGTMTAEAALLGVPSISCYPGETTRVESFMVRKELVRKIRDPIEIAREVAKILDNPEPTQTSQKKRASAMLSRMEDPVEAIYRTIKDLLETERSNL